MLSERSQPHKDKYSVVPLAGGIENSQIQSQKNKGEWLPGAGWGNGEMLFNGHKVSRQKDKFWRPAICSIQGPVHHLLLSLTQSIANNTKIRLFWRLRNPDAAP